MQCIGQVAESQGFIGGIFRTSHPQRQPVHLPDSLYVKVILKSVPAVPYVRRCTMFASSRGISITQVLMFIYPSFDTFSAPSEHR